MYTSHRLPVVLFYVIFAISGFSGIIYESIWSHYLKLFLGHAAYAQALVLAIFMGGMALGAWLASHYSVGWQNLLRVYALVEGAIGLLALIFHPLFDQAIHLTHYTIIPNLGSMTSIHLFKWTISALFILPQSVLLGMTFPLMSAGLIRYSPQQSGSALAILYFSNSLGAAIGVLVSGFVLIELVGLPGTVMTAGLINFMLALTVWLLAKTAVSPAISTTSAIIPPTIMGLSAWYRFLLFAAFLTGAASFLYEIGWIRMLSLVLGSSTHAFELMLSAFIFGLAFGGLWIKRRIQQIRQPIIFLGIVQIIMGFLALLTLPVYNQTFDGMKFILDALNRTEEGYALFNFASHLIALLVMVPATFCAGMTLPLITYVLLQQGQGEKAIGNVYAANTLGAILSVFFAVHLGLPLLGLKGLISLGAALDIGLGLALLFPWLKTEKTRRFAVINIVSISLFAGIVATVNLDVYKMAAGVYRSGMARMGDNALVLYHRDGKTATVDLVDYPENVRIIKTNGKSDAALRMIAGAPATSDEATMILLGALPLIYQPNAKLAANIGMGSGFTAHVLLGSHSLERLDTIEIEPSMVKAAEHFRPLVERAFTDPRSRIHIEDAKTFFVSRGEQYDIIVSEPSNPWVSGVASLFSAEFYDLIRHYLKEDGVFIQWLQLYEIDMELVSSIVRAFAPYFNDYVIYNTNDNDAIFVLKKSGSLPPPAYQTLLANEKLVNELQRVNINQPADFAIRRISNKPIMDYWFASFGAPANSDYFPFLDLKATRARFLKANAGEMMWLKMGPLPLMEMLEENTTGNGYPLLSKPIPLSSITIKANYQAQILRDFLLDQPNPEPLSQLNDSLSYQAVILKANQSDCGQNLRDNIWLRSLQAVADALMAYLSVEDLNAIWQKLDLTACIAKTSPEDARWIKLFLAISQRQGAEMATIAEEILSQEQDKRLRDQELAAYTVAAAMLGYLSQHQKDLSRQVWERYAPTLLAGLEPNVDLRLLVALSVELAESKGQTHE